MVSMAGVDMQTAAQGGVMAGLKRAVGGESFFINTFTAQVPNAQLTVAPVFAGEVIHWPLENQTVYLQSERTWRPARGSPSTRSGAGPRLSSAGRVSSCSRSRGRVTWSWRPTGRCTRWTSPRARPTPSIPVTWSAGRGRAVQRPQGRRVEVHHPLGRGPGLRPHRSRPDLPPDPQRGQLPRLADPQDPDIQQLKRGVYLGSFDPLTIAHVAIAEAARDQHSLDRLDLVISRIPLGKDHAAQSSVEERGGAGAPGRQSAVDQGGGHRPPAPGRHRRGLRRPGHGRRQVGPGAGSGVLRVSRAQDAAVAGLPVLAVAPRPPHPVPVEHRLEIPAHLADVSATEARDGRHEWRA